MGIGISSLNRKLLRELWSIRAQALAICLVIGSGMATFVMSISCLQSLSRSREAYYHASRFAEVFLPLKRAPLPLLERLAEVPGIRDVSARIVFDVSLDVPGLEEPAIGRLISLPAVGGTALNEVYLRRGRMVDPDNPDEVIASEAFAQAHGFQPGSTITAVINGRRRRLEIVGIGLSPEYLIQIRAGSLLPDDKRYAILWMNARHLAAAVNMEGAFNDFSATLLRGAKESAVLQQLDDLTEQYGGRGSYPRADQVSHQYISDEIRQLRSMGILAPSIFLSVSAFLLNVVFSRLIGTQRVQIAELKAFGYSGREIGWHYVKMVLAMVFIGVTLGAVAGIWMGHGLTGLYSRFYRFPEFRYQWDPAILTGAFLISAVAALAGTGMSVRRATLLPPAEAMRPEPPARFQPTIVERMRLASWLSPPARMILRQLERRPLRALLSALGIAMAVSVLILGSFGEDAVRHIISFQFETTQRQDVTVTFFEPLSEQARYELGRMPGVFFSEAFRGVPCKLHSRQTYRRLGILGLAQGSELHRLHDTDGRPVELPPDGLVVSDKLARLLDVEPGSYVEVELLEGRRERHVIQVVGVIREYAGLNAYMDLAALHRLLREQGSISGAYLRVDALELPSLYAALKSMPTVAGVLVKKTAITSFEDTIAENLMVMRTYNVIFATIIAFGVVYNAARISLAERSRELATLRVLGFTRTEVSLLLLGELSLLTLLAIPVGLGLGYALSAWTASGMDTELYRIPLVIRPATFGWATLVTVLAAIVSGLVVRRRIDQLDLISVLKTME